jgi:glutamine amidotransferase
MCRLLGIVASEPTDFRIVLSHAPRSMAALSAEHRDGWGLAVFDASHEPDWRVDRGVDPAREDARFHERALGSRGELLIAHIRQKTVGATSLENTHPFRRGRWVFAHNGTIKNLGWLLREVSPARRAEVAGQTDSELFFAYLLTRLDEAGLGDGPATLETDAVIARAAAEARGVPAIGAFNFLLSDGNAVYAHRFGRTLCLLERGPDDAVRSSLTSADGVVVQTPWSQRRRAVFVASEKMTDEPWQTIDDGMLLRLDRTPQPRWRLIA